MFIFICKETLNIIIIGKLGKLYFRINNNFNYLNFIMLFNKYILFLKY